MELLPQADSMVRQLVPGVLDVAGMADEASELRQLDMLSCTCSLARACEMLSAIRVSELPDGWAETVEDATFWAEAALWAAAESDLDMFRLCDARVRAALERGFQSMSLQ